MIEIDEVPWRAMLLHAEQTYPNECCGVLLGAAGEPKHVTEAAALLNAAPESHHNRYQIDPADLLQADRDARRRGLDLIGIYHSHPDCDAYFSETDLKESCPWYSFVVLSVKKGKFDHASCYLPDAERTHAEKEEIVCPKF